MTYEIAYYTQIVVAAVGVAAGVLAGVGYTGARPSWETMDVSATAGIVAAICAGFSALLPRLNLTPAARETAYVKAATTGVLPDDLAAKHSGAQSAEK